MRRDRVNHAWIGLVFVLLLSADALAQTGRMVKVVVETRQRGHHHPRHAHLRRLPGGAGRRLREPARGAGSPLHAGRVLGVREEQSSSETGITLLATLQ